MTYFERAERWQDDGPRRWYDSTGSTMWMWLSPPCLDCLYLFGKVRIRARTLSMMDYHKQ